MGLSGTDVAFLETPGTGWPVGLAVETSGRVLATTHFERLLRIDPQSMTYQVLTTFDLSPVSVDEYIPWGVAVEPSGTIFLTTREAVAPFTGGIAPWLVRVDPGTGAYDVFSDFSNIAQGTKGVLPSGIAILRPHPKAGDILVVDFAAGTGGRGALFTVDPSTGDRKVVTDFTDATQGPLGFNPSDVVVDAGGNILVTDFDSGADQGSGALFSVDAATGNRTFLSDFSDATQGPTGVEPSGLAIFPGGVGFPGASVRDLAVTKIVVPAAVKLTVAGPSAVKSIKVQIQNRGTQAVQIADATTLQALVALDVASFGACPAPVPSLIVPGKLPITLKSKQRLTLGYGVNLDCANDPAKTTKTDPGHDDFELSARVTHAVLGGADDHPGDDVCPRSVTPPFAVDPFPDRKIKDKGCGERKPDNTLGAPVLLDVVID